MGPVTTENLTRQGFSHKRKLEYPDGAGGIYPRSSVPETSRCNLCWARLTSGLSTGFTSASLVLAVTLVETGFRKGRPAANAFFFERLAHPAVFAFDQYCVGGRWGRKSRLLSIRTLDPWPRLRCGPCNNDDYDNNEE